jgi:hypothetical protein
MFRMYNPVPGALPFGALCCALCFGLCPQVFTDEGVASKDYIFERGAFRGTTLHVRSAPSPGCTASLAIAEHVVNIAQEDFKWVSSPPAAAAPAPVPTPAKK